MLITSFCFAQQATKPATPSVKPTTPSVPSTPAKLVEIKSVTGKIQSATLADPAKGTKSEIIIADDSGQKYTFLVKSTTTIYDADWKAITLDKIKQDDKVGVTYSTTKEGVNEATSIRIKK